MEDDSESAYDRERRRSTSRPKREDNRTWSTTIQKYFVAQGKHDNEEEHKDMHGAMNKKSNAGGERLTMTGVGVGDWNGHQEG